MWIGPTLTLLYRNGSICSCFFYEFSALTEAKRFDWTFLILGSVLGHIAFHYDDDDDDDSEQNVDEWVRERERVREIEKHISMVMRPLKKVNATIRIYCL